MSPPPAAMHPIIFQTTSQLIRRCVEIRISRIKDEIHSDGTAFISQSYLDVLPIIMRVPGIHLGVILVDLVWNILIPEVHLPVSSQISFEWNHAVHARFFITWYTPDCNSFRYLMRPQLRSSTSTLAQLNVYAKVLVPLLL